MLDFQIHKLKIKFGLLFQRLIYRLFSIFPKSFNLVILDGLTHALNISSISYNGRSGEFFGSPYDRHAIGQYVTHGTYSTALVAFITDSLKSTKEGTFIDIGANIGLVSIPVAQHGINCICFEPDPRNFYFLKLNMLISGMSDLMTLHNIALYSKRSELIFERSGTNSGDHRIRINGSNVKELFNESSRKTVCIQADRLDDALSINDIKHPIVVKIDTQGAEAAIVEGGSEFLSQADILIFEYSPYLSRRQNNNELSLIQYIQKHFHSGCVIDEIHGDTEFEFNELSYVVDKMKQLSDSFPHLHYVDVIVRKKA